MFMETCTMYANDQRGRIVSGRLEIDMIYNVVFFFSHYFFTRSNFQFSRVQKPAMNKLDTVTININWRRVVE